MADSRMVQVQKIFLQALEVPSAELDEWLARECESDETLIPEVRSLLDHAEPTVDLLEQNLDEVISDIPRMGHQEQSVRTAPHEVEGAINPDEFLSKLSNVGVLSPDEFASVSDSVASGDASAEPRQLASQLVTQGKLTEYQASALLKGEPELLIDKYLILDLIDVGGMGMVFKAIHRTMNRLVGLKMISHQMLASADLVKRFQREVRVAATLEHPNIVRAYDADVSRGVNFLVLEYVRGDNLSRIVRSSGPLSLSKAVSCIRQAAVGLQHAHERGIVHRDIKPGNLLLNDQGTVKVLDLGLAHIDESMRHNATDSDSLEDDHGRPHVSRTELTAAGAVLGTASFMAPEQSLDAHLVDFRSDIYSLGCTLYFLLTGDSPYTGNTVFKVFVEHREAEIPLLKEKRPDVPDSIEAVFRRMVSKQPDDRFQSMGELILALDDCRVAAPDIEAKPIVPDPAPAANETPDNGGRDEATIENSKHDDSSASRGKSSSRRRSLTVLAGVTSVVAAILLIAVNWPATNAPENNVASTSVAGPPVAGISRLRETTPTTIRRSVEHDDARPGSEKTEADDRSAADLIASGYWEWKLDRKLPEPINSPNVEFGADMTADGLTIVVSSENGAVNENRDLLIATRATPTAPWSDLVRLPSSVNTDEQEISPEFSDNGLTLSFIRRGQGSPRCLTTRRDNVDADWAVPVETERGNGLGLMHSVTRDRLTAFKLQKPTPSSDDARYRLLTCRRSALSEPFGELETSILGDSGLQMGSATLSNDGRLSIYIQGGLWMVTRSDWSSPWSKPISLLSEFPGFAAPRLLSDDRTLLFASGNPNGGGGKHDIYMARLVERPEPPKKAAPTSPADLLATGEWEWQVEKNLGPTINSPSLVFGADMTADGLTIIFSSLRDQKPPGNRDLWFSKRSALDAPWSEPVRLPEQINTDAKEEQPHISSDGLRLWFTGNKNARMYSERESLSSAWSKAAPDPYSVGNIKNYQLTPDGLAAFRLGVVELGSNQSHTDGTLMTWRRESLDSPFQKASDNTLPSVPQIHTPGAMSDDGRMYVFTQFVDNGTEARPTRLFYSTRSDRNTTWSKPAPLFADVSDNEASSGSPRILDDNRTLLFSSNMKGGQGSFDIWLARLVRR